MALVEGGADIYVSIPRGGPLYVEDMVGPLTRVPDFENSVFQELQSLNEMISCDSLEAWDDEIRVDELKIISDDELFDMALQEASKGDELADDELQVVTQDQNKRETGDTGADAGTAITGSQNSGGDMMAIVPSGSPNSLPLRSCGDETSNKKQPPGRRKKRKRSSKMHKSLDEICSEKVEQVIRIKQKQEEVKATVSLHSFNGSSKHHECQAVIKRGERIRSLKAASVSTKVRSSKTCDNIPLQFPEVVLGVEVYHNRRTWLKTQEFLVLGRQFLTEVRDKIYCSTDEIMRKAGQHDPSGYFLIEDVFCNDMREPSSMDYSKPILDWLQNSKSDALEKWEFVVTGELQQKQKALLGSENKQQLPAFKALQMQTTRFCDIRFRLGAGYLYCHQGDCKHLIVIRDMRLLHPEDVQNRAAYPLVTFQLKLRHMKCSVCKLYRAKKITVDDKWAEPNPCYFCDACYYLLHYADGSLLYDDFSVYDYHHE